MFQEIVEELSALKEDIIKYLTEGDGKELNATSVYLEEMNKREVGQTKNRIQHIYGSEYITDTILGLKFRISAASFFQVICPINTLCLYTNTIKYFITYRPIRKQLKFCTNMHLIQVK